MIFSSRLFTLSLFATMISRRWKTIIVLPRLLPCEIQDTSSFRWYSIALTMLVPELCNSPVPSHTWHSGLPAALHMSSKVTLIASSYPATGQQLQWLQELKCRALQKNGNGKPVTKMRRVCWFCIACCHVQPGASLERQRMTYYINCPSWKTHASLQDMPPVLKAVTRSMIIELVLATGRCRNALSWLAELHLKICWQILYFQTWKNTSRWCACFRCGSSLMQLHDC